MTLLLKNLFRKFVNIVTNNCVTRHFRLKQEERDTDFKQCVMREVIQALKDQNHKPVNNSH